MKKSRTFDVSKEHQAQHDAVLDGWRAANVQLKEARSLASEILQPVAQTAEVRLARLSLLAKDFLERTE